MAKIHELSQTLTNQIAAGEVIERPASVVKELIENSLDAKATRIHIDVIDSGLKQITVQDNGIGIGRDQIDLAFMRHATSKINNERDLFKVSTLGFRGEALASIAAVAHVEMITNTPNSVGIKAIFSGGKKKSQEDSAARQGTKIIVKDLFFNTPARLKYLRSPRTEMLKIVDIVNRIALGYPQVAITLTNSSKVLLRTSGNGKIMQTVANIYGRHTAEKMIKFKTNNSDFEISGLISKPDLTRSNRNFISLLLNGRYIHNFKLTAAIIAGYGTKLATKHYPIAIVAIKVDPLLVDVNVHPTKQEVRLSKETELSRLITSAISDVLLKQTEEVNALDNLTFNRQETITDQLKFNLNKSVINTKRQVAAPLEVHEPKSQATSEKVDSKYVSLNFPREDKRYVITPTWTDNVNKQVQLSPFTENQQDDIIISTGDEVLASAIPNLIFVGQTKTYLIAKNNSDLFLIDQLAARRRIAYEHLQKQFITKKIVQQELLTPLILEFGNLDFIQIKEHLAQLKEVGILLEDFGQDSFIVRSYPTWLQGDIQTNLRMILDNYLNFDANNNLPNLFIKIANLQITKTVARYQKLNDGQAREILASLIKTSDPYYDMNGQLIIVKLSYNDLQKMFKKDK